MWNYFLCKIKLHKHDPFSVSLRLQMQTLLLKFLFIILSDIKIACFLCGYLKVKLLIFSCRLHFSLPFPSVHFNKVKILSKEVLNQLGKNIQYEQAIFHLTACDWPSRTSLLKNKLFLALLVIQPKCREADHYSASLFLLKETQSRYELLAGVDTISLKRGKLILQSHSESHRSSKLTRATLWSCAHLKPLLLSVDRFFAVWEV